MLEVEERALEVVADHQRDKAVFFWDVQKNNNVQTCVGGHKSRLRSLL